MTDWLRIPNENGFYANLQPFNKKEGLIYSKPLFIAHLMTVFL